VKRYSRASKAREPRRRKGATPTDDKICQILNRIAAAAARGDYDLADELLCIDLEDAEHQLTEDDR
jgi:hypothetical protein